MVLQTSLFGFVFGSVNLLPSLLVLVFFQVVVLNKIDLPEVEEQREKLESALKEHMGHTRYSPCPRDFLAIEMVFPG